MWPLDVSRKTKYLPPWALAAPVLTDGVLEPLVNACLPDSFQPHIPRSKLQLPMPLVLLLPPPEFGRVVREDSVTESIDMSPVQDDPFVPRNRI